MVISYEKNPGREKLSMPTEVDKSGETAERNCVGVRGS